MELFRKQPKKLRELLASKGIHNGHELAGHGNVYITRIARSKWFASRYMICRVGYRNDPDASFVDHGNKAFTFYGGKEAEAQAFEKAKAWATDRYKMGGWVKTPFGDWMSAPVLELRLHEILEGQVETTTDVRRDTDVATN